MLEALFIRNHHWCSDHSHFTAENVAAPSLAPCLAGEGILPVRDKPRCPFGSNRPPVPSIQQTELRRTAMDKSALQTSPFPQARRSLRCHVASMAVRMARFRDVYTVHMCTQSRSALVNAAGSGLLRPNPYGHSRVVALPPPYPVVRSFRLPVPSPIW